MRNLLLFAMAMFYAAMLTAQRPAPANVDLINTPLTRHYQAPADIPPPMLNTNYTTPGILKQAKVFLDETEIIETIFDLQSNATLANRFISWDDGTMAAVATYGVQSPANYAFPDRGTAYNYFDGSQWGPKPSSRIEDMRTGWPSIAPLGPNGEIVVSHISGTETLVVYYREQKGTDDWMQLDFAPAPPGASGLLWPRVITSGPDNTIVHVIALSAPEGNGGAIYEGQDGAMLYYRSMDGGQSWDIQGEILQGLGSEFYNGISSDNYTLATQGDMVVILNGGAWKDMFIMKSMDNGDTWEKTMIWEHPYPFFDFDVTLMDDTLYAVDNSANMAIDNDGMVHVVWGVGRVARLAAAPPEPGFYSYWPYTDGIGYWNESMGQIPEADNPHHTMMPEYLEELGMLVGWTQDVNNSGFIFDYEGTADTPFGVYRSLGISTMPTIAIVNGLIKIAYASVTETFVTADGLYNYHHIWTRHSYDMGETWGDFLDLQGDNIFHLFDECIYPVFAPKPNDDGTFHLIYNADNFPGIFAFADDHDPVINRIIHLKSTYLVDVNEVQQPATGTLSVSQNYPNPASGVTHLTVDLQQPATTSVEVFNLTGQKVSATSPQNLSAGSHSISLDISGLNTGIYFYTVTAGSERISRKMMVD